MEKEALGEDGMREGGRSHLPDVHIPDLVEKQPAPRKKAPEGSFFTVALNG